MRRQEGQGTLEYLAVVMLVAVVIAAAAAAVVATGLGERIVGALKRGLCVVAGQACEPPKTPCVTAAKQHSEGGVLDVLVARIGEQMTELREHFADGSVAYTLVEDGDAGLVVRAGAEVHVSWGTRTWAYGEELKFAILAGTTSGRTWIRRTQAAADDIAFRAGLEKSFKLHPPPPDITFSEVRGAATASIALTTALSLDLGASRAYGERIDRRTGERTVYLRNAASGSATLLLPNASRADAGVRGEERYAVTYGRDGRPRELTVLGAVDVDGAASVPPHVAALAGQLGIPVQGGRHIETEQHLDLLVPENAAIAKAFLGSDPSGGDVALAATVLRDRIEQEGSATARSYRTTARAHEVGAHVMGIGGGVGDTDTSATLDRALSRGADGQWVKDPMCES